jgi:hypothetical protein
VLALGFFWVPSAARLSAGSAAAVAGLVFLGMLFIGIAVGCYLPVARRVATISPRYRFLLHGGALAAIAIYVTILHGEIPALIYQFF